MPDRIVAHLQAETSLQGLAIGDPRFGLDAGSPRIWRPSADIGVPRSEVALDREWHLGSPSEAWVQPRPQSLEERELSAVPDRIAGGVRTDRQVQSDHRAATADCRDGDSVHVSALETHDLLMRDAARRRDVTEAQPGADPRLTVLTTQSLERLTGAAPASVGWSFSRSHPADVREWSLPADQPRLWSARRTNGRTTAVHGAGWTYSCAPRSARRSNGRTSPVPRAWRVCSTAPLVRPWDQHEDETLGAARPDPLRRSLVRQPDRDRSGLHPPGPGLAPPRPAPARRATPRRVAT